MLSKHPMRVACEGVAGGAELDAVLTGPESGGPSMTVFLQQQCSDTRWLTVNSGLGLG